MFKSASIYLLGGILNSAIPFLLLPVLTRYLSPKDYGSLAIFQVMLSFTTPLVGMNMQMNIARSFAKMSSDAMARLIGNMSGILCVSTVVVGGMAVAWTAAHGPTFDLPAGVFLLLPLMAALVTANEFYLTVLRHQERPLAFCGVQVGSSLLNMVLSLVLVVGLGYGWLGRLAGIVCASCCFGIVGLVELYRGRLLVFGLARDVMKDILRISLPLIPHTIGGTIILLSDRLFLDHMVNRETVGVYAVGYSFGMIVNLFVDSFSRAWAPWFYRKMDDVSEGNRRRLVRRTYAAWAGALVLALAVTGASWLTLPYLVSSRYQGASQYIGWVAVGYAFRGMYTLVFPYLVFAGRTNFLGFSTAINALVNLVLNYYLIRFNGAVGAAQATLISWLLLFLCTWSYSARICHMPWFDFKKRGIDAVA